MSDFKVDFELTQNMECILKITCPNCKKQIKKKFRDISKDTVIKCCRTTITFSDDELRELQKSFDGLKKTLNNFGK